MGRLALSRRARRFFSQYLMMFLAVCATLYAVYVWRGGSSFTIESSPNVFEFYANETKMRGKLISTQPKEMALYMNYFDQYACPYYSDRADLIAPEMNRFAQFMRSFGSKVIFHTLTIPSSKHDTNKHVPEITDNHLDETSPLLQDKCLFDDYNSKPAPVTGNIHYQFLYSKATDYFANDHTTAVRIALDLNVKYLLVGGMRCNMWLPAFFEQLKSVGITPIYIYDMSDVVFFREAQKEKVDTHLDAVKKFWLWLVDKGYLVANHWKLLDRETPQKPATKPKFDGNTKTAYYFKDYFEPDL